MVKISIITVVLNSVSTIRQTIESVLLQQYKDCEYIIIDGGSTDGTHEVIEEYNNYIDKVICEPDEGLYDAMNKGIKIANGDIIGIINADDRYREDALQKIVNRYAITGADVICGEAQRFDNSGYGSYYGVNIDLLWLKMAIAHPATFVARKAYMKYGIFDIGYRMAADYDLMLRMYDSGAKFEFISDVLTDFRTDGISDRNAVSTEIEAFRISLKYSNNDNRASIVSFHERVLLEMLLDMGDYRAEECLRGFLGIQGTSNIYEGGLCIYGAGHYGRIVAKYLSFVGIKRFNWVDSDKEKWGNLEGIHVQSPDIISSMGEYVIIAIDGKTDDIKVILKKKYMCKNVISLTEWAHCIAVKLGVYSPEICEK